MISTAVEYTLAISIELARRALPSEDDANVERSLELSAYFTVPKLEIAHRHFPLIAALKLAAGKNNLGSALGFANRILANGAPPRMLEWVIWHLPRLSFLLFQLSILAISPCSPSFL